MQTSGTVLYMRFLFTSLGRGQDTGKYGKPEPAEQTAGAWRTMPTVGLRYALVGFSAELDWRPLHFLKPIPQNRICRACGLVCVKTALLPCMHVLCESCCEQCAQDGGLTCPLDNQHGQDGEVDWKECLVDDMLRREVACWNEEAGCRAVMAASEMYRHFRHECGHHLVSCSKCSGMVLRKDICSHLRSECRDPVMPLASECEAQLSCKDKAFVSFFTRSLEQQACEMKAFFERLLVSESPRDAILVDVCHSLNTLRETLSNELSHNTNTIEQSLGELAETVRQNNESSASNMLAVVASNEIMKKCVLAVGREVQNLSATVNTADHILRDDAVNATEQNPERLVDVVPVLETSTLDGNESSQRASQGARNGLRLAELRLDSCVFFVNDVQSLKEGAVKDGQKFFFTKIVYLRGYCLQPGLKFIKDGDSVSFHICFLVTKGYVDEALTWPFSHKIKLSFINSVNDTVRAVIFKPTSSAPQGPAEADKRLIKVEVPSLDLEDLIRDGYMHDDKLLVKWELLA